MHSKNSVTTLFSDVLNIANIKATKLFFRRVMGLAICCFRFLNPERQQAVSRDVNDNTSSLIIKLRYRIVSIAKRNENI